MQDDITEIELVERIKNILLELGDKHYVSLTSSVFAVMPCTKRRLYAVCKKHATSWGYVYHTAEYQASGNRAFQKNHKRGTEIPPSLCRE